MTGPQRYIKTLERRRAFISSPTYFATTYALAEIGALDWALANLKPIVERQVELMSQSA